MNEVKIGRRERRRRKAETGNEFQKAIENAEFSIKPRVTHSLGKLVRRDTFTVVHSKSDFDFPDDIQLDISGEGSENDSAGSRNLTYSLNKTSTNTYSIEKPQDEIRPVPAPRRWKSANLEQQKPFSDTDGDITEIDLDDSRAKSSQNSTPNSDHEPELVIPPVPKPRKTLPNVQKPESESDKSINEPPKSSSESSNSKIKEEFDGKSVKSNASEKSQDGGEPPKSNQIPIVTSLQGEDKSEKRSKIFREFLERKSKRKKSKTFSSLMKLEGKKIPRISSILKDLKEEKEKPEVEIEKTEFQIESPRYPESEENGRIYVQSKNGFYVMEKDEVLKSTNGNRETDENGGVMEDSTVKTAILFQKYWSRSMTYFHGVLAGFGFSHAATVTAIMLHYNYEPHGFISVYSCLSLKIHYVFYTLTALCILSCFDRLDVGHMNQSHWQIAWKVPSMWVILIVYIISFILTFANQTTEARFDALPDGNETDIWDGRSDHEVRVSLLQWYHTVCTRDVLVLFAWLVIALTKFDDFLFFHINNMAKYAELKGEEKNFRQRANLS